MSFEMAVLAWLAFDFLLLGLGIVMGWCWAETARYHRLTRWMTEDSRRFDNE